MPVLNIKVREKIAQTSGSPEVVCGNSDYVAEVCQVMCMQVRSHRRLRYSVQ